jgi:ankyrin repeat protein
VKNRKDLSRLSLSFYHRLEAALVRGRIRPMSPSCKRLNLLLCCLALAACFAAIACVDSDVPPTPGAAKRFLKLRGYDFNQESFFKAAADGDVMAVNGFISAGMDVNVKNKDDDTALTAMAAQGNAKVIDVLLRAGADVNANGRNGWTALLLALQEEHFDVVDLLLAQPNLDLKAETPDKMTALMVAVWHQQDAAVRALLKRGADVNHQDNDGDTAVHGAALYGNAKILGLLLDAGANPNLKNKLGGTALMWAAAYGHDDIVRDLLYRGADPKIRDIDGVSAAGWAAKNGQTSIVMTLRQAEKEQGGRGQKQ